MISVVKSTKKIGRSFSSLVDSEDRALLGMILVWALALLAALSILGLGAGLAVRLFEVVAG